MQQWSASPLTEQRYQLGEGPFFSPERGLTWVNIPAGELLQVPTISGDRRPEAVLRLGEQLGVAVPHESGGWLCGAGRGIRLFDARGNLRQSVDVLAPGVRMNDGKTDSLGRFWVGSKAHDNESGRGSLFRQNLDGSVDQVLSGLTIANGLGWDAEDSTMYLVDSPTRTVYAFDFDRESGRLTNQQALIVFDESDGYPDGLCVDRDGCLWIAAWGGRAVFRHTSDGDRIGRVDVPTPHVTSCCFAGEPLDRLVITTAWDELSPEIVDADSGAGQVWSTGSLPTSGDPAGLARVTETDWPAAG
jgi:sugar lactone lactonase YvrE